MTLVASSGVFVLPTKIRPARAEPRREPRVFGLGPLQALQQPHAAVERLARGVTHGVLHEERHAVQRRPDRLVDPVRGARFGAGALEALVDDRVEGGVQGFDPRDRGVDELRRRMPRRARPARPARSRRARCGCRASTLRLAQAEAPCGRSRAPDRLRSMDDVDLRRSRSLGGRARARDRAGVLRAGMSRRVRRDSGSRRAPGTRASWRSRTVPRTSRAAARCSVRCARAWSRPRSACSSPSRCRPG